MSGTYIIQNLLDGISLGSIYALVAIGFSMTYSILRLINFAHGDILMIGAYCAVFIMVASHLPLWAGLLGAMLFAALIGMMVERVAFRPLRGANEEAMLLTSLAVSIFIENLGIMTVSAQPCKFETTQALSFMHQIGEISVSNMTLLIFS